MEKKGFTLVELLVVIAIIGVLSIIIVPSVINVNRNINIRLLDSKKQNITAAATTYASRNDDIFNGVEEVPVYVYELIDMGYVEIDVDTGDTRCDSTEENQGAKGCVLNPTKAATLNKDYVILRKQGAAGYFAEYHESNDEIIDGETYTDKTLVTAVCDALNDSNNPLTGKTSEGKTCTCTKSDSSRPYDGFIDSAGNTNIEACIISGDNPNNYLKYGDSKPNWRVLGVYKIDGSLSAKMITSEPI